MTSLDLKNVIQQKMRQNGITDVAVAKATGYTKSDLSRWFNGKRELTNEQAKFVYSKVVALTELIAAVHPLPIDLRRADVVSNILTKISDRELEFSVKNPLVPHQPAPGLMALSGMGTTFQSACLTEISDRVNQLLNKRTY
jgi:Helix-turn-helix